MMKRMFIIVFMALFSFASQVQAEQDFSQVEIKTIPVRGNIYMLEGAGGNIGVTVGEDGVLLIDDQFAPLVDKIKAAVRAIDDRPIKFVINTHWHYDHTGGNEDFGKTATIIAHDNVRRRLSKQQTIELFNKMIEPKGKEGLPVITFSKSISVHFNGEEIKIVHMPNGHTDTDSVIYFTKSNVVHSGDHVFVDQFPFVDVEHGGDVYGFANNLKKIIGKIDDETKVIPGHGPLTDKKGLERLHAMIVETAGQIEEKMANGKTLEEIQSEGLDPKWESWGHHFIDTATWIKIVYSSLTNN